MLQLPLKSPLYRVLGIDPGTDTLGVAVLDLNLELHTITLVYVTTLVASKNIKQLDYLSELHTERFVKLQDHQCNIAKILEYYQPHCVISESPYLGRFANAFAALTECLLVIKQTVLNYNPWISLELIDPPNVKKSVGAPGKGGDKELIRNALKSLNTIQGLNPSVIDQLDEHSIDAIAVAYSKIYKHI